MMSMMAKTIALRSGNLWLRLGCRGGVILDFRCGNQPLLRPASEDGRPETSACFPLVPLGNRIRDNRFVFRGMSYEVRPNALPEPLHLHGAGWQADWTPDGVTETSARLIHVSDNSGLPHRYRAEQSFALTAGGLTMGLSITNTGEEILPFGIGWHPFFADGAVLTAAASGFWTEGPGHLPAGRTTVPSDLDFRRPASLPARWINNAFDGWNGHARIEWPDRSISLTLTADPIFAFYQLYRPEKGAFFAFEPMSHLPDGLSMPDLGGLVPLAPGESLIGSMTLTPLSRTSTPATTIGDLS